MTKENKVEFALGGPRESEDGNALITNKFSVERVNKEIVDVRLIEEIVTGRMNERSSRELVAEVDPRIAIQMAHALLESVV